MNDFKDRIKVYYDSEFTGLHKNTTLISIGLVSESGAYFYAEFNDYDESQVDRWIEEHVIQNLQYNGLDEYYSIEKNLLGKEDTTLLPKNHLFIRMKGNKDQVREQLILWLRREADALNTKVQIYTDCYAYDWMLLMDLLFGNGLSVPDYLDYIPIDLSTMLYTKGVDPDIKREDYIGTLMVEALQNHEPFIHFSEDPKHNALWDAFVARECFDKVTYEIKRKEYSSEAIQLAFSNISPEFQDLLISGAFLNNGIKEHPEE